MVCLHKQMAKQKTKQMTNLRAKLLVALAVFSSCAAYAIEAPEGVVYCYDKTTVEFAFDRSNQNNDVFLTVDGKTEKRMTAYSWFGSVQMPPMGFKFAILGEGKFDPLLVFEDHLLDVEKHKYVKCN